MKKIEPTMLSTTIHQDTSRSRHENQAWHTP
jgi:hypothetical protein